MLALPKCLAAADLETLNARIGQAADHVRKLKKELARHPGRELQDRLAATQADLDRLCLQRSYVAKTGLWKKCLPELPRLEEQIEPTLHKVLTGLLEGRAPWPLFLYGPPGTGKTCAVLWALDWAGGVYHSTPDVCKLLIRADQGRLDDRSSERAGDAAGSLARVWPEAVWEKIDRAPLAVLDEIGCRDRVSDAHYETVKSFIDRRLNRGKALIVISNLDLEDLGKLYDGRIFSRLASGTVFDSTGPDRRVEEPQ